MTTEFDASTRPVAVITGGGRGIGRGITLALAASGHDVVIGWTKGATASDATAADVAAAGARAVTVQGDVVDPMTSTLLAQAALDHFGRLDCWVNNAGVLAATPILDLSLTEVTKSFEINYLGTFHGLQVAARTMVAAGRGGRIVNISSEAGLKAWPLYGAYTPTKFAQIGLTQVAALELGVHGILVNAVCPGLVETDMVLDMWPIEAEMNGTTVEQIRADSYAMTPTRRLATPADVGAMVAWLASPGASNVTGQAMCVNGGLTLH